MAYQFYGKNLTSNEISSWYSGNLDAAFRTAISEGIGNVTFNFLPKIAKGAGISIFVDIVIDGDKAILSDPSGVIAEAVIGEATSDVVVNVFKTAIMRLLPVAFLEVSALVGFGVALGGAALVGYTLSALGVTAGIADVVNLFQGDSPYKLELFSGDHEFGLAVTGDPYQRLKVNDYIKILADEHLSHSGYFTEGQKIDLQFGETGIVGGSFTIFDISKIHTISSSLGIEYDEFVASDNAIFVIDRKIGVFYEDTLTSDKLYINNEIFSNIISVITKNEYVSNLYSNKNGSEFYDLRSFMSNGHFLFESILDYTDFDADQKGLVVINANNSDLFGSESNDIIVGSFASENIHGFSGDDWIICDPSGLRGDSQGDTVFGGTGSDHIYGGALDDVITGDEGADVVYGGGGTDRIYGGEGNDIDEIVGGDGEDYLYGDGGDDSLTGGNSIAGKGTNDDCVDHLFGGMGKDKYYVSDKDIVNDSNTLKTGDSQGVVYFDGIRLEGGTLDPCGSGEYFGIGGIKYTQAGTSLTVRYGNETITIEGWINKDFGIELKPAQGTCPPGPGPGPGGPGPDRLASPLVLDLDGDGIEVTNYRAGSTNSLGVYFDITNDGLKEYTNWVSSDDGLLSLDLNGNGKIDNAGELFGYGNSISVGSATDVIIAGLSPVISLPNDALLGPNDYDLLKYTSGFAKLAQYDLNFDGKIDASDVIFNQLLVWRDLNQDGVSDDGELFHLRDLGIESIKVGYDHVLSHLGDNLVSDISTFTTTGGIVHNIGDVWFRFDGHDTRYDVTWAQDAGIAALPAVSGSGNLIDLRDAASLDAGLRALVEDFKALGANDLVKADALVSDILYRWAGVDGSGENAFTRGAFADNRHIAVFEAFRGTPFAQWSGPDPRPNAGASLEESWRDIRASVLTYLILQSPLGHALFPEVSFQLEAFLVVEDGARLQDTVTRFVNASAGMDLLEKIRFLHAASEVLITLESGYSDISSASDPHALFASIMDAMMVSAGLSFSFDQLLSAKIGSDGIDSILTETQYGLAGTQVVIGGAGDDEIHLGGGSQIVFFAEGSGHDVISATNPTSLSVFGSQANTEFRLVGLNQIDVSFTLSGGAASSGAGFVGDLVLTILATGETLTIRDWYTDGLPLNGVVKFADGSSLTIPQIADLITFQPPTSGNDQIFRISGDTDGGAGNDMLFGGQGNNIYHFGPNSGDDTIVDLRDSNGDQLVFDAGITIDDLKISIDYSTGNLVLDFIGGTSRVEIDAQYSDSQGVGIDQFIFSNGIVLTAAQIAQIYVDRQISSEATDLFGTPGDDVFAPANGHDYRIQAFDGDNFIATLDGDDVINSGSGDDIISTGAGNDSVDSGGGNDTISTGEGDDRILVGSALAGAGAATIDAGAGDDYIISWGTGGSITAGAGNDLISGLNSNYIFAAGSGNDYVTAQHGTATFADLALSEVQFSAVLLPMTVYVPFEPDFGGVIGYAPVYDHFGLGDSASGNFEVYGQLTLQVTFAGGSVLFVADPTIGFSGIDNFQFGDGSSLTINELLDILNTPTDGDQNLIGLSGDDILNGGGGNDNLFGYDGDNVLAGGTGNDVMLGGNGADTYVINLGDGVDVIQDYGLGYFDAVNLLGHIEKYQFNGPPLVLPTTCIADQISFGTGIAASDLSFKFVDFDYLNVAGIFGSTHGQTNGYALEITIGTNGQKVYVRADLDSDNPFGVEELVFANGTTMSVFDILPLVNVATSLDDILVGYFGGGARSNGFTTYFVDGQADVLSGGDGNDRIYGFDGNDILSGEGGDDYINGGAGTDTLSGGAGNDIIIGNGIITGGSGDDTITGSGDITGGQGNDIIHSQNAIIHLSSTDGHDIIYDQSATIVLTDIVSASRLNIKLINSAVQNGAGDLDYLITFNATCNTVRLAGADLFKLQFSDGSFLNANQVRVLANLPTSEDQILLGIHGISNNLVGGGGNDLIISSYQEYTSTVGTTDILNGGVGNDVLNGGIGSDTYLYNIGDGSDVILEKFDGDASSIELNTLRFGAGISREDVHFSFMMNPDFGVSGTETSAQKFYLNVAIGAETIRIFAPSGFGEAGSGPQGAISNFVFNDGSTMLLADILAAATTDQNDIIISGQQGSTLYGGGGNDQIMFNGFNVVNTAVGGTGNDAIMIGGGQSTTNVNWNTGDGPDTVSFSNGYGSKVVLNMGAGVDPGSVSITVAGSDIIVRVGTVNAIVIKDGYLDLTNTGQTFQGQYLDHITFANSSQISQSQITSALQAIYDAANPPENQHLSGTDGNDSLDGGAGRDVLSGGLGSDHYVFGLGYNEDTVIDTGGTDTVVFNSGVLAESLAFTRIGNDLLIEIDGLQRNALTIKDQFLSVGSRVENFTFADGVTWTWSQIQANILANSISEGANEITDFVTSDVIRARGGDDKIHLSAGNDIVDGGSGRDIVYLNGSRSDYDIAHDGSQTIITSKSGDLGTKTLYNVEEVVFSNDVGTSDDVTVVFELNHAPIALNPTFAVQEDGRIRFLLSELTGLAASDSDSSNLTISAVRNAIAGTIVLSGTYFDFVPTPGFVGAPHFEVVVSDGELSVVSTVSLTVNSSNHAPVLAHALVDQSVAEDAGVSFVLPADAFSDVDGDTLTLSAKMADGTALPTWLSFNATTRTFSGTPPLNFNGVFQIEITANDGHLTASNTFALTITPVNDAPNVAHALVDQSVAEDTTVSFALPANVFSDVDGDALTLSAKMADGSALPAWLSFNAATRIFAGTPPLNYNGVLQIAVTASDSQLTASDVFTLTVTPVNDAPFLVIPLADLSSLEDHTVNFVLPQGSFSDLDGDALNLTAKMADGSALPTWLSFNTATQTFTGTPPLNFNGVLQIAVTASDGQLSASDVFALTITPVNDAPIVANALVDQSVAEDNAVTFVLPANTFSDVDGDALALTAKMADGSALPTWLSFNTATQTFTGTPPLNFNGVLQIAVTASDGQLSACDVFALTITPVNDAPIVANALVDQSIAEDNAVTFVLPANAFSDVDGDALALTAKMADGSALPTWLSFNSTTQTFSGTPPLNFNGVLQVVVTASDGQLTASDVFALTITPVNDAPILVTPLADVSALEDHAVNFVLPSASFSDVDGDTLNLTAKMADGSALPTWLSFNATTKTFAGTPPLNFNGVLQIAVTASDGQLSASDVFALTITPVNDAPIVANALVDQSVAEDNAVTFVLPANAFSDVDGNALALTAKMADGAALPIWLSFNTATRTFSGTPPLNFNGVLQIAVTASDGQLTAIDVFTLTVTPVNDAPILVTLLADQTLAQNQSVSILVPQVAFTDVDGDVLSYSATLANGATLPSWLVFNTTTRMFTGTPPVNFNGILQVVVTASDGVLTTSDQFALTITPSPVDPYAGWQKGTAGADILLGCLFTENRIYGDAGNDILTGGLFDDRLDGGSGDDILLGLTGKDILTGGAGNDFLDGGFGADTMSGGTGNDTYMIDDLGDLISEAVNAGTDTVLSSVSYTLTANVENLTLTGTGSINGTGNDLNNVITGNSGNNTLDGGLGADTLIGNIGNDTYFVDNLGDVITEAVNAGTDSVYASTSWVLGANLENLTLTGSANLAGTGNALDNIVTGNSGGNSLDGGSGNDVLWGLSGNDTLIGNSGNDRIIGGQGRDFLTGGIGNDLLVFSAVSDSGITSTTRDVITDFTIGQDKIDLSQIDANAFLSGDQAFSFLSAKGAAFTGVAGQLNWYQEDLAGTANDKTIVSCDINGDKAADFQIEISNLVTLHSVDFIL